MYVTNITDVRSCKVGENPNHPANVPDELVKEFGNCKENTSNIGKQFIAVGFNTERGGSFDVDLIPIEKEGKLEIYLVYIPNEGGRYNRKIVMDIETGDELSNTLEKSEDFHSKFPFTKDQSE